MRYLIFLFAMSLAGCAANDAATPVQASNATNNNQVVNDAAKDKPNEVEQQSAETEKTTERLICRNEDVTGSNRKVRTCRKASGN